MLRNMRSLLVCVLPLAAVSTALVPRSNNALSIRQANPPGPATLTDFQVSQPILTPSGTHDQFGCIVTQVLMEHDFAFSFGEPFVGNYTPPPCSFNRVTINFTVTSSGRQFDRLAFMYLGDIEVFRTSTAEPSAAGIIWTYVKEMQHYNTLWQTPQKLIFDLPNLINSEDTGIYNTTLSATFFTVPDSPATADIILPISLQQSAENMGSVIMVPPQNASVSVTLPRNVQRAVVSIAGCGQIAEEFWYTDTFQSQVDTFGVGSENGGGPFRELQLLIDGELAGVVWPFPIIFTGGIAPTFWRPIVGIDAFDLREHEIDITPWLPLLSDGNPHTFAIQVMVLGLEDGEGTASLVEIPLPGYWLVDGKIFLFLDKEGSVTTGTKPVVKAPPPTIKIASQLTQNSAGVNETLVYTTTATRSLSISSTVKTSAGSQPATWSQTLSYSNFNNITSEGFVQTTIQNTTGVDLSSSGYANSYSYPLEVFFSQVNFPDTSVAINGTFNRGLDFSVFGPSVFPSGLQNFDITSPSTFSLSGHPSPQSITLPPTPPFSGSILSTTQSGTAQFFNGVGAFSFGITTQEFSFSAASLGGGASAELYSRNVTAVNSTVVADSQSLLGQTFGIPVGLPGKGESGDDFAHGSPRSFTGRGPG